MKTHKKFRPGGFTFIEMMIAISVFSIGIVVVLQMIIKNLHVVDTAKLHTSATLLAKEGIELAYNIRDANIEKGLPRDCLFDEKLFGTPQTSITTNTNICASSFASGITENKVLKISYTPEQYIWTAWEKLPDVFLDRFGKTTLFYQTGEIADIIIGTYTHRAPDTDQTEIPNFARYLVFSPIIENENTLPSDYILKIESHVLIQKGGYTGEVVLESFVGGY